MCGCVLKSCCKIISMTTMKICLIQSRAWAPPLRNSELWSLVFRKQGRSVCESTMKNREEREQTSTLTTITYYLDLFTHYVMSCDVMTHVYYNYWWGGNTYTKRTREQSYWVPLKHQVVLKTREAHIGSITLRVILFISLHAFSHWTGKLVRSSHSSPFYSWPTPETLSFLKRYSLPTGLSQASLNTSSKRPKA